MRVGNHSVWVFDDQVRLAEIYCDDGAFRTGASVLRKLADKLEAHAEARELALNSLHCGEDGV